MKKLVVGKVQINAAAAAGNGQVTDVTEFREVIVQEIIMGVNMLKFGLAHVMHGLGVSFPIPNF